MSAMFIGAVELGQALTFDRRATQVASSTADLAARAEKQISHTEIGDIMKVGGYILEPYSQTPLEIALRNVTSSPAYATTTKQSWSSTYKGLDKTQTLRLLQHPSRTSRPTCSPATTAAWSPRSPMAQAADLRLLHEAGVRCRNVRDRGLYADRDELSEAAEPGGQMQPNRRF